MFELCNYDIDVFLEFPFRAREGEIPFQVLKNKSFKEFKGISIKIAAMFGVTDPVANRDQFKYKCWAMREIQLVFEYYCLAFKAAAPRIENFLFL